MHNSLCAITDSPFRLFPQPRLGAVSLLLDRVVLLLTRKHGATTSGDASSLDLRSSAQPRNLLPVNSMVLILDIQASVQVYKLHYSIHTRSTSGETWGIVSLTCGPP